MRGRGSPVTLARNVPGDPAGSIDQDGVRMAPRLERRFTTTVGIKPQREWDLELFAPSTHVGGRLAEPHVDDKQAPPLVVPEEFRFGGSLPPTLRSGRREEAEEDGLAAKTADADVLSGERAKREIWRCDRRWRPHDPHGREGVVSLGG